MSHILPHEVQFGDSELLSRDSDLEPPSTAFPYGIQEGDIPDTAAPSGETCPQSQQQDMSNSEVPGEVEEPLQELNLPIRDGAKCNNLCDLL